MLVRILDMVGQDVTGKRVDIRSRNPDGALMYPDQDEGPLTTHVRTLTRVYFKLEGKTHSIDPRKVKWLYWEWGSNGSPEDQRCSWSGLADPNDWERYHLEVLEP